MCTGTQDFADSAVLRRSDAVELPRLPPEIVYEIFVIAYRGDPKRYTNFLCVSKAVSDLVIPLLYEAIITEGTFKSAERPSLRVLRQHGHHVKYISLSDFPNALTLLEDGTLLGACPNVSRLAFWNGFRISLPVEAFNLSLSHIALHTMYNEGEHQIRGLKQTDEKKFERWSSSMTHIAWGTISLSACDLLPSFPNLTHFLFGDWNISPARPQEMVDNILRSCPRLEVVVVIQPKVKPKALILDAWNGFVFEDARIVVGDCYPQSSWLMGMGGEDDLWAMAERAVEERRKRNGVS